MCSALRAARLVALDWGTTSLRAALLGERGAVLAERSQPWGILHLPEGGFEAALQGIAGDWTRDAPAMPLLACGMVGSAQGWREVPYLPCPADAFALADALMAIELGPGTRLHIVPGVRSPRPDVMRGEETQALGAMLSQPTLAAQATLLMPGTHSKWVDLRDGRIDDFRTFMTGELFALLREHSILGRAMPVQTNIAGRDTDADTAFERGVCAAWQRCSATALLFGARAQVLTGQLAAAHAIDYVSGLLIGDELRQGFVDTELSAAPLLIGETALCARYSRALRVIGLPGANALQGMAWAGLWHIAQRARLVGSA